MAAKKNILTQEGLKQLEDEMNHLTINRRAEIAVKIKEAREQGDLSENAEYDAALDEQREIESRIAELKSILNNAEIADGSSSGGVISIGNLVKLYDKAYDEEVKYRIVGSTEADSLNRKISNESPVGSALVGRSKGHEVIVDMRDGKTKFYFTILEVYETSDTPVSAGSVVRLRGEDNDERIIEISQPGASTSADDVYSEDSEMAKVLLGQSKDVFVTVDKKYKIIEVMYPKKEDPKPAVTVSDIEGTAISAKKSKAKTPQLKSAVKVVAAKPVVAKAAAKPVAAKPTAAEKPATKAKAATAVKSTETVKSTATAKPTETAPDATVKPDETAKPTATAKPAAKTKPAVADKVAESKAAVAPKPVQEKVPEVKLSASKAVASPELVSEKLPKSKLPDAKVPEVKTLSESLTKEPSPSQVEEDICK